MTVPHVQAVPIEARRGHPDLLVLELYLVVSCHTGAEINLSPMEDQLVLLTVTISLIHKIAFHHHFVCLVHLAFDNDSKFCEKCKTE